MGASRRSLALALGVTLLGLLFVGGVELARQPGRRALVDAPLGATDSPTWASRAATARPPPAARSPAPALAQGSTSTAPLVEGVRDATSRGASDPAAMSRGASDSAAARPAWLVVLGADDLPLPDATVEVLDAELRPIWSRPVDGRGERLLEARGPWVRAAAPGHATSEVHAYPDGERLVLRLPVGGGVRGVVTDVAGLPLPGVSVALARSLTETDAAGQFALQDVLPGTHRLWLSAPGHYQLPPDGQPVLIVPGRVVTVAAILRRGGVLRGRVVDHAGRPQAAVRIVLSGLVTRQARTDGQGAFELDGLPPGPHRVEADRGSDVLASALVQLESEDEPATVELRIPPAAELRGRVVDADGAPVAGARVRAVVVSDGGLSLEQVSVGVIVRTAADGSFVIPDLPPGTYRAEVAPGEDAPFLPTPESATGGEDELLVALPRTRIVRGVVTDLGGAPLAGAVVEGTTRAVHARARTDALGEFALTLPSEAATLRASAPGYAPAAGSAAGFVAFALQPAASLLLRVTDGEDAPFAAPDATLLTPVAIPPVTALVGSGLLRLAPLAPGNYQVRVDAAQAAAPRVLTVVVQALPGVALTVTLERARGVVSGRVVDEAGAPLAAARIASGAQRTISDAEGRFALAVPPAGAMARIAKLSYAPARALLLPGPATIVLSAGDSLKGIALRGDGAPAAGLELVAVELPASGPPRPLRSVRVGQDGAFALGNLPPGAALAWRLPGEEEGHLLPLSLPTSRLQVWVDDPRTLAPR